MSDDPTTTPLRRNCGAMAVHRRLLDHDDAYAANRTKIENQAQRADAMARMLGPQRTTCREIPVVVHVVHNTDEQNISDAQVTSQIDVLNEDFRKANADVSSVPSVFAPLAADAQVTFVLASVDPDGNPTSGITRTETDVDAFNENTDDIKFSSEGGVDAWPTDAYLNLWVGPLRGGLLGYAQFPGGPADTDGVVCTYRAFGTTGTAQAPFDKGRTATHEIGHWLNLFHIWGDDGTGCHGTDHVADTPNQAGPNTGTPSFPSVSCSNGPDGDMFMNYMDYVDDAAMVMFTTGQVVRMQAALDGPRVSVGTEQSCDGGPVKPLPKDTIKELPKEPGKELPKEPIKDLTKEPIKDLPKDGGKDLPKEPIKDLTKEPGKDLPKDVGKDPITDPGPKSVFEPPKGVLEPPKGVFEPPKSVLEPPKGVFEPPKGILEPPKGVFEPPKSILEPPKGVFEPPKGVVEGPGQPGGPGLPFVLGTGGRGEAAAGQPGQQAQANLLAMYQQVLMHYAMLARQGLLDAQGHAGWQAAWEAYRQLGGA